VWAKPVGTVVRIAVAKTAARLAEWSGESVPGSIASDLYAFNTFAGCTDTSYNSTRHELGGSLPSAVDASLGVQGRCSIDLSSLPHWERRYIRVSAKNVSGEMFSDTMIVAHVPPGMVYVDATDWPDQGRHAQAERLNETYASTHSFAIDKFEVYRNGDYLVSSAFSLPYSEDGKAFFASGCSARGTDANEEFGEWAAVGRQYRLAGGAEWVVAAFQTPDVSGPGYCYIHGSGATAALNGGSATDNCISRYGARNMIGNLWEWTAEELDPSTLPAADRVVGWDWDNAVPAATSAAGGAFANDRLYNVTSSGPHAVRRGGSYRLTGDGGIQSTGSNAGRFAIAVDTNLVDDRVDTGGRCVISAP
jgi:hypothetical protein